MCFLGDRTVGHSACFESFDDGVDTLHFIERYRSFGKLKIKQSADIDSVRFTAEHSGILFVQGVVIVSDCRLQGVYGAGIVKMLFFAASAAVLTARKQFGGGLQSQRIESGGMQPIHVVFDILQGDAADPADSSCEIFVDQFTAQTDGFKVFGALIRLQSGNAHLGSDLDNAVKNGVIIVIDSGIIVLVEKIIMDQLVDGFER